MHVPQFSKKNLLRGGAVTPPLCRRDFLPWHQKSRLEKLFHLCQHHSTTYSILFQANPFASFWEAQFWASSATTTAPRCHAPVFFTLLFERTRRHFVVVRLLRFKHCTTHGYVCATYSNRLLNLHEKEGTAAAKPLRSVPTTTDTTQVKITLFYNDKHKSLQVHTLRLLTPTQLKHILLQSNRLNTFIQDGPNQASKYPLRRIKSVVHIRFFELP